MENDINKPLHLEFIGLPGCGKSTISHRLSVDLRKVGYKVVEPSFDMDHQSYAFIRKLSKLFFGAYYYCKEHQQYKVVSNLVKSNGYRGRSAFMQIVNIAQKLVAYKRFNGEDYVVWDQGISQAAISLSTHGLRKALDNESDIYAMLPDHPNVLKVFVDCTCSTALKRMSGRKNNDSRVEKMASIEEKVSALTKIESDCEELYDNSGILLNSLTYSLDEMHTYLFLKITGQPSLVIDQIPTIHNAVREGKSIKQNIGTFDVANSKRELNDY